MHFPQKKIHIDCASWLLNQRSAFLAYKWVLNEVMHSRQWFNTLIPRSSTVGRVSLHCCSFHRGWVLPGVVSELYHCRHSAGDCSTSETMEWSNPVMLLLGKVQAAARHWAFWWLELVGNENFGLTPNIVILAFKNMWHRLVTSEMGISTFQV